MKQLCDILGAETVDSIPYRLNEGSFLRRFRPGSYLPGYM